MKISRYLTASLLGLFLVGCSKPKPPSSVLESALSKELPAYLSLSCRTQQFSPIHEVLGTTLPEGSYQIDMQCAVSAKEPLYVYVSLQNTRQDPRLSAALQRELAELDHLSNSVESRSFRQASDKAKLPALKPFLARIADQGASKEISVKVIAEPRGKDWLINVVEGEPQAVFSKAKPRSGYDPSLAVYGSDEQRQDFTKVQAAYENASKREEVLKTLEPRIAAIRSQEQALANQYYREAGQKMAALREERKMKSEAHDRRIAEINRTTSDLNDNYKMRNELIKDESKRWEHYSYNDIAPRMAAVEQESSASSKRAEAEIEKRIQALLKEAGLEI